MPCTDLEGLVFKRQDGMMRILAKVLLVAHAPILCIPALRVILLAYKCLTAAARLHIGAKGVSLLAHMMWRLRQYNLYTCCTMPSLPFILGSVTSYGGNAC